MPFTPVPEVTDGQGGNFPVDAREFYNTWGRSAFLGNITFPNVNHIVRTVPVFEIDGLDEKPDTLKLVRKTWKAMENRHDHEAIVTVGEAGRSIHQNTSGNLPYPTIGGGRMDFAQPNTRVASSGLRYLAATQGQLPNNQQQRAATTRGEFLEITCGDGMHAYARLVVDYRFGVLYITLGHYHPDSFAVVVRHNVELQNEIRPILSGLGVRFSA